METASFPIRHLRSHSRIEVFCLHSIAGDLWHAKLWLVDLAGSERLGKTEVDGQQLKEAQFINKSLSALGDCIHGLCTKSSHIPFRNSKLTYVLQVSAQC